MQPGRRALPSFRGRNSVGPLAGPEGIKSVIPYECKSKLVQNIMPKSLDVEKEVGLLFWNCSKCSSKGPAPCYIQRCNGVNTLDELSFPALRPCWETSSRQFLKPGKETQLRKSVIWCRHAKLRRRSRHVCVNKILICVNSVFNNALFLKNVLQMRLSCVVLEKKINIILPTW